MLGLELPQPLQQQIADLRTAALVDTSTAQMKPADWSAQAQQSTMLALRMTLVIPQHEALLATACASRKHKGDSMSQAQLRRTPKLQAFTC